MKGLGLRLTAGRLTTVLAILLGLAYALVLSGRIADDDSPVVANTSGGGLSAFAALLSQSGYRIRVEDGMRPAFAPDEFVIVPAGTLFPPQDFREESDPEAASPYLRLPSAPGGMMVLTQSAQIRDPATRTLTNRVTGTRISVRTGSGEPPNAGLESVRPTTLLFRETSTGSNATLRGIGTATLKGNRLLLVERGEMASNRYLDTGENAALLMGLIRSFAGNRRIVFYEGVAEGGSLLGALGKWAYAARNQAILALLLLVATLGSRFGLAPMARRRETGQREQSDAIGNLLRRWRGPRIGIEAAIEQARRRLVAARKMPASTPRDQWPKYLSPTLIEAIEDAEEWGRQKAGEREALRTIAKLDAEIDAEVAGVYRKG